MCEVEEEGPRPKLSLLEKYDVPVDHLDFAYLKTCTKVKELEKIVKILRSREEGYYPDLLKAAEEKLGALDPSSRLLRVQGKLLNKDNLEPQYWKQIFDDIQKWSDECSEKERDTSKQGIELAQDSSLPPIRKPPPKQAMDKKLENSSGAGKKSKERKNPLDYSKWDKYDADAECVKMDVEEVKRKSEPMLDGAPQGQSLLAELEALSTEASKAAGSLSKVERERLASKEKETGNEFYKTKDFREAVRCYTKSLAINPTSFAYNNRAAAFLSMERYEMAVSDSTSVLELEPNNIKALYRRAQANEKLSEFSEALLDLNAILKLEPDNMLAKAMRTKLKKKSTSSKPKSSAKSSAKRSKLTLDSSVEPSSSAYGEGSGLRGPSTSGAKGELIPIAGPSGLAKAPPPSHPVVVTPKKLSNQNKPQNEEEGNKKKDMWKVAVLEIDREEDSPLFDWRRYCAEGRSAKIDVASKFKQKSKREVHPQDGSKPEARSQPLAPAPGPPAPLRCLQLGPAHFTQSWDLLSREKASIYEKAKLLRSVPPHLLPAVIGNKLDEGMLSDLLHCLKDEIKSEMALTVEYLNCFPRLDRFSIIKTFLPSNIQQVIQELMDLTDADETLRKLYK